MKPPADEPGIRDRVLSVIEQILGYPPDPDIDHLDDLDSLQVLELLVSLEDEFDIDSDEIIAARSDWWTSLDDLVASIASLRGQASLEESKQG